MSAAKRTAEKASGTAAPQGRVIRPYGDTTGDGMVQLSFTLPIPHSKVAEGAAAQLVEPLLATSATGTVVVP